MMSRWEDERHLRISDSAKWVAFAAVEAGFLEPGDGLSLLVLSGDGAADIWPALDLLDRIAATGDRAGLVAEVDRLSLVIRKDLLPRPRRLFIAWVYNRIIRLLFGGDWRDVDCAFKLFRHDVFERVPLARIRSNGAFFSPELLITLRRAGMRIRQVGVRHLPRTAHEPKGASSGVILRAMADLLRLRVRLWLRSPAH